MKFKHRLIATGYQEEQVTYQKKRRQALFLALSVALSSCTARDLITHSVDAADSATTNKRQLSEADFGRLMSDKQVEGYIEQVLERMAKNAKSSSYPLFIYDGDLVNGSAGLGMISITRGMLNAAMNEAEIAGYLGHEIGHLDAESDNSKPGFLKQTVMKGLAYVGQKTGTESEIYQAKNQAGKIQRARRSQALEEAADHYGAELAAKAGYNPFALADLFDRISNQVNTNVLYRLAKLKGTHRALDVRATRLRAYLKSKGYKPTDVLGTSHYQTSLAVLTNYDPDKKRKMTTESDNAIKKLSSEVDAYLEGRKEIPFDRFVAIMKEISALQRKEMKRLSRFWHGRSLAFMEEAVVQPTPFWSHSGIGPFEAINRLLGKLGLSSVGPEGSTLKGSIGLFELLTGHSFADGAALAMDALKGLAGDIVGDVKSTWSGAVEAIDSAIDGLVSSGAVNPAQGAESKEALMSANKSPELPPRGFTPREPEPTVHADPIPPKIPTSEGDTIPPDIPAPVGDPIPPKEPPTPYTKSDDRNSNTGTGADAGREQTPTSKPAIYQPIKGTDAKKNKETGEIWVKDKSRHGGDHWEVYKDQRAWEKGIRDRQVWADGKTGRNY